MAKSLWRIGLTTIGLFLVQIVLVKLLPLIVVIILNLIATSVGTYYLLIWLAKNDFFFTIIEKGKVKVFEVGGQPTKIIFEKKKNPDLKENVLDIFLNELLGIVWIGLPGIVTRKSWPQKMESFHFTPETPEKRITFYEEEKTVNFFSLMTVKNFAAIGYELQKGLRVNIAYQLVYTLEGVSPTGEVVDNEAVRNSIVTLLYNYNEEQYLRELYVWALGNIADFTGLPDTTFEKLYETPQNAQNSTFKSLFKGKQVCGGKLHVTNATWIDFEPTDEATKEYLKASVNAELAKQKALEAVTLAEGEAKATEIKGEATAKAAKALGEALEKSPSLAIVETAKGLGSSGSVTLVGSDLLKGVQNLINNPQNQKP